MVHHPEAKLGSGYSVQQMNNKYYQEDEHVIVHPPVFLYNNPIMLKYLIFIALIITGCHSKQHYRMDGHLESPQYDGEKIYLVPFKNPAVQKFDSAIVKNSHFSFDGFITKPEIEILRSRPQLRLKLQQLLVVKEPGKIIVSLGKQSSSRGTPLNDSLEYWKENKIKNDSLLFSLRLRLKYKSEKSRNKNKIERQADSLEKYINEFHFNFVKNNKNNVVGEMVNRMVGSSFDPEQKKI